MYRVTDENNHLMEFCLYTWGANSYGQLGQGHMEDLSVPVDVGALPHETVLLLCGGGGHSVVVMGSGKVFVCGQNHRGQLGLGHTANVSTLHPCSGLSQKIANVSCGWDFTLFLTDCGQVLTCGSNSFGQLGVKQTIQHSADPMVVEILKEPVLSVAAGLRHSLAITDSGCVYQWGLGLLTHAKRALGPNPVPEHLNSRVPSRVPGFEHVTAHTVAAGSTHCVCLTGGGDVFLWGSNKYGQLATNDSFSSYPRQLKRSLLDGEGVAHVWSGWTHLVAKTDGGKVFTWGRGNYGQLGRTGFVRQSQESRSRGSLAGDERSHGSLAGDERSHGSLAGDERSHGSLAEDDIKGASLPGKVDVLYGATQIGCGSEHNLAVVGGCLFCWGWNEHGMCGDGSQKDVAQPQQILGLRPLLIGCGAGHAMALCAVKPASGENTVEHTVVLEPGSTQPGNM